LEEHFFDLVHTDLTEEVELEKSSAEVHEMLDLSEIAHLPWALDLMEMISEQEQHGDDYVAWGPRCVQVYIH
jgi:hypothetical protein